MNQTSKINNAVVKDQDIIQDPGYNITQGVNASFTTLVQDAVRNNDNDSDNSKANKNKKNCLIGGKKHHHYVFGKRVLKHKENVSSTKAKLSQTDGNKKTEVKEDFKPAACDQQIITKEKVKQAEMEDYKSCCKHMVYVEEIIKEKVDNSDIENLILVPCFKGDGKEDYRLTDLDMRLLCDLDVQNLVDFAPSLLQVSKFSDESLIPSSAIELVTTSNDETKEGSDSAKSDYID